MVHVDSDISCCVREILFHGHTSKFPEVRESWVNPETVPYKY